MGVSGGPAWQNGLAKPEDDGAGQPGSRAVAVVGARHPLPAGRPAAGVVVAERNAAEEIVGRPRQPTWWALLVAVGGGLACFAICLFAPDWGEAARQVAILACVLAVICLLTGLLYLLARARPYWPVWLGFGVLFAVLGFYELPTAVVPLHLLQAEDAQAAGRYDQEYTELRLAGVGPCDPRATSALLGWARQDQQAGGYGDAIIRLEALARDCPTSPDAETARGQIGQTKLAWGEQLLSTGDYADAVTVFAEIEKDYAATPLAPAARQDAAATYVAWAEQQEHAGHYGSALAKYQTVLGSYPDSQYAVTARDGAAQTLFDWGQSDTRLGRYNEAAAHYGQLVDLYPGSPQAAQASALLVAPQPVVGRLTYNDGSAAVGIPVRLSSEWQFGGTTYTTAGHRYTAVTDSAGLFTLDAVPPGKYLIEWQGPDGRYTTFVSRDNQPLEVVNVPRLHPLQLDTINIDPNA